MVKNERYSRQENINGWNQNKLSRTGVCLVGRDRLSDFILLDLLAIGIGKIARIGFSDFFEFEKINQETNLEQIDTEILNSDIAETYIPETQFIVEASNDPEQKLVSLMFAQERKIPFISASSTPNSFMFCANGRELENIVNFHVNSYYGQEQGNLNSMICSAMVTDELRKRMFSLEYDIKADRFFCRGVKEKDFSLEHKKFALIGAGGSGTFVGLCLALEGSDITIIDFDTIEESNLNRQIFFYDSLMEYKAKVLAKRLQKYGGKFEARAEKIDSSFNPEGYDAILSCVDNFTTRLELNGIASKFNIPLVNCGISLYEGEVHGYIPGKTACLDCQMLGVLTQETEKESKRRSCVTQPSLIMPNQIVGALLVYELKRVFYMQPKIIRYGSGEGIFMETPKEKCNENCSLYEKCQTKT